MLLAKDVLRFVVESPGQAFSLDDILRPATFIPESKRLDTLLEDFRKSRNHMAIVVDEYGGVAGLVTIEDVLEQIVGDIDDEHDVEDIGNIRRLGVSRYSVKALTPVDEFNDYFKSDFSDEDFDTLAGLVMTHLGHLPKRGESVVIDRFLFKIMSADSRRIKHLQVLLLPAARTVTDAG